MKLRDIKRGGVYYVSFENEKRRDTASMEYEEWLVEVLGVQEKMGTTYIVVRSLRERKGVPNDMFGEEGYSIPRSWITPRQPKTYYIDTRDINKQNIMPGTTPYSWMSTNSMTHDRIYPLYAFFEPKLSTVQIAYLLGRKGVPSEIAGIVSQFYGGPIAPQLSPPVYSHLTERNTRKAKQAANDLRANTMRQSLKEIRARRAAATQINTKPSTAPTNKPSAGGGSRRRAKVTSRLNRRTRRKQ